MMVNWSTLTLRVVGQSDRLYSLCFVVKDGEKEQLNGLLSFRCTLVSFVSATAALVIALVQNGTPGMGERYALNWCIQTRGRILITDWKAERVCEHLCNPNQKGT